MPWGVKSLMEARSEFVRFAIFDGSNIAQLCRQFGISRRVGCKWLSRYKQGGKAALEDQSKRPAHSPRKTSDKLVAEVLKVRDKHPCWGGLKIHTVLERNGINPPSPSCIQKILKENNRIKRSNISEAPHRFEHEAPNHLWQMDFKGHFAYEQGRCHPLTVIDDHSRFSVAIKACSNETGKTVKSHMVETFGQYGVPSRINVDNGNPWGSPLPGAKHTKFSIWLMQLGITVSHSRPGHPQTNGKLERFHRTLKHELLLPNYFSSLEQIQVSFDEWRHEYNLERPHQAIDMQVPADRYEPCYREYSDSILPYEYSPDYKTRKVDQRGRTSILGRHIYVGTPFSGELLGLRNCNDGDGIMHVYFRHQRIGTVNLNEICKGTMVNLYAKRVLSTWEKVLPMSKEICYLCMWTIQLDAGSR